MFYKAKIAATIPKTPVKETPMRSASAAELLAVAALGEEPEAVEPPISKIPD